jgi:hypothetical protein
MAEVATLATSVRRPRLTSVALLPRHLYLPKPFDYLPDQVTNKSRKNYLKKYSNLVVVLLISPPVCKLFANFKGPPK